MAVFGHPLPAVIVATAVIDVGLRFSLAAVQAIICSLEPAANRRIDTFYITALFGGHSPGSFAASAAWLAGGWSAVCLGAAGIALLAVLAQFWPASDRRRRGIQGRISRIPERSPFQFRYEPGAVAGRRR